MSQNWNKHFHHNLPSQGQQQEHFAHNSNQNQRHPSYSQESRNNHFTAPRAPTEYNQRHFPTPASYAQLGHSSVAQFPHKQNFSFQESRAETRDLSWSQKHQTQQQPFKPEPYSRGSVQSREEQKQQRASEQQSFPPPYHSLPSQNQGFQNQPNEQNKGFLPSVGNVHMPPHYVPADNESTRPGNNILQPPLQGHSHDRFQLPNFQSNQNSQHHNISRQTPSAFSSHPGNLQPSQCGSEPEHLEQKQPFHPSNENFPNIQFQMPFSERNNVPPPVQPSFHQNSRPLLQSFREPPPHPALIQQAPVPSAGIFSCSSQPGPLSFPGGQLPPPGQISKPSFLSDSQQPYNNMPPSSGASGWPCNVPPPAATGTGAQWNYSAPPSGVNQLMNVPPPSVPPPTNMTAGAAPFWVHAPPMMMPFGNSFQPEQVSSAVSELEMQAKELTLPVWLRTKIENFKPAPKDKRVSAMQMLKKSTILLEKLKTLKKTAEDSINNEFVWNQTFHEIKQLQKDLQEYSQELSKEDVRAELKKEVQKRKKKRERLKRRAQEHKKEQKEKADQREELHKRIDEHRTRVHEKALQEKQEQEMKKEADEILSEIRYKISSTKEMLQKLNVLGRLRNARKESCKKKGLYVPEEADKNFESNTEELKALMQNQLSEYLKEESALKVFLETEKKEEHELKMLQNKQNHIKVCLFGEEEISPELYPFWQFYTEAERNLTRLISVRQEWDQYLVPSDSGLGTSVPIQWVKPVKPSSQGWSLFCH